MPIQVPRAGANNLTLLEFSKQASDLIETYPNQREFIENEIENALCELNDNSETIEKRLDWLIKTCKEKKLTELNGIRKGYRSVKNGHLGVYTLCSGPDPSGPVPGERVIIVIYNKENKIVRTLEQVKGNCIDPGWIDFFNTQACRPSVHEYHIIDTDANGKQTLMASHTSPSDANRWLTINCPLWVQQHGIPDNV
jgi:hypothetical protein